jgi:hypothetical protein
MGSGISLLVFKLRTCRLMAFRVNAQTKQLLVNSHKKIDKGNSCRLCDEHSMETDVIVNTSVPQDMDHQYLTATNLKSFFYFGCQLEIWKSFHEGHLPQNPYKPSPISMAHFSRGRKWEALLVKRLDEQKLVLRYSKNIPLQSQIEKDPRDHFYIINSRFQDDNLLQKEFLDRGTIPYRFGLFKPDFIEIHKIIKNGKPMIEYHIIDAKASRSVQVCLSSK